MAPAHGWVWGGVSRYGAALGGSNRADVGSSVEASWCVFAGLVHVRRIVMDAVIDCLAKPLTLAEVERKHRMRRAQAFDNACRVDPLQ
jgi:hypothetical protein